jgi:hypothetical protein
MLLNMIRKLLASPHRAIESCFHSPPPTIRFKQVIQVNVKGWGSVGVISMIRHNPQSGTWSTQLFMAGLMTTADGTQPTENFVA